MRLNSPFFSFRVFFFPLTGDRVAKEQGMRCKPCRAA